MAIPDRIVKKFWQQVDKHGPQIKGVSGRCWMWIGYVMKPEAKFGYGLFHAEKTVRAHKFSLRLHGIEIPIGSEPHHVCLQRACIRPSHMRILTRAEHQLLHHQKTECVKGHPFDGTQAGRNGKRWNKCLRCHAASQRRYMENRRAML